MKKNIETNTTSNEKYSDVFNDFMREHGKRLEDLYHKEGGTGEYFVKYTPIRKAVIRVETVDGRLYDYSESCPDGLRAFVRESACEFDDEYCREEFSRKLIEVMMEENVTPLELSELTGITKSRIDKFWKRYTLPSYTEIVKLSTALNRYSGDLVDCI